MYCSYKELDHIFKVLTEKCEDRPVNRKSACSTRGASRQKVCMALLRDLKKLWNQKKVKPSKVSW